MKVVKDLPKTDMSQVLEVLYVDISGNSSNSSLDREVRM